MFGIELLAAPVLHALISMSQCPAGPYPEIKVRLQQNRTIYDKSKSTQELGASDISTISPYGADKETQTLGLMSSNVRVSTHSETTSIPQGSQACLSYKKLIIIIHNSPTIFIAKDIKGNLCRHNSTLVHEEKHVTVDKIVLKKYISIIKRAVRRAVSKMGTIGPMNPSDLDKNRQQMSKKIEMAIQPVLDKMYKERARKQQKVDSLREYERLSKRCGGKF